MGVLRVAGAGDLAGRDLQGGVEAGGAVALVVVGHPGRFARLDRQRRLGAIQRLDLGLLIHADDQSALRRIEVEPDDVDHLLDQLRVLGELERADLMRFELVIAPDPMHRRGRDPGRGRQPAHAPMRRPVRRGLQRHRQHRCDLSRRRSPAAVPSAARSAALQARARRNSVATTRPSAATHRSRAAISVFVAPSAATQHDPRAHRLLLGRRRGPQHRAKLLFLLLGELDRRSGAGHNHHCTRSPLVIQAT